MEATKCNQNLSRYSAIYFLLWNCPFRYHVKMMDEFECNCVCQTTLCEHIIRPLQKYFQFLDRAQILKTVCSIFVPVFFCSVYSFVVDV